MGEPHGQAPTSAPSDSGTRAWTDADRGVPHRAPGIHFLGLYQGSAANHATYLVRRRDDQVIQLSALLHAVLAKIDGVRTTDEAASLVSTEIGRTVSSDNIDYLVSTKLQPLGLIAGGAETDAAQYDGLLTVKLKRTVLPKRVVGGLARLLQPTFHPLVVAIVLAAVVAFDCAVIAERVLGRASVQVVSRPALFLLAIGLVLLGSMFHECGHAAGCRYGGATPGRIGVGFYVVWPAFFTDVSDSYRLNRAGRIRTDLGGVYFNLIFILGIAALYLATGFLPLLVAILLVHIEMFRQLLPSLRLDGYWILSDAIGVPDLFRHVRPILLSLVPGHKTHPSVRNLKRPARFAITVWVLAVVPVLLAELVMAVVYGPRIVATVVTTVSTQVHTVSSAFSRADVTTGIAAALSAVLMVLPLLGVSYILLSLGRRGARLAFAFSRRQIIQSIIALRGLSVVDAGRRSMHRMMPMARKGHHKDCPCMQRKVSLQRHGDVAAAPATQPQEHALPPPPRALSARRSDAGGRGDTHLCSWSAATSQAGRFRWLRVAVPLAFAAGVGLGILITLPETSKRPPTPRATGSVTPRAAASIPEKPATANALPSQLPIARMSLWDPQPDGDEHYDQIPLARDGNPDTAWFTEDFATSDISGIKSGGVGLIAELGSPQPVSAIQLILPYAGTSIQVRAANIPSGRAQDSTLVQTVDNAPQNLAIRLPTTRARYWLVGIVKLAREPTEVRDAHPYKAGIAEMHFLAS